LQFPRPAPHGLISILRKLLDAEQHVARTSSTTPNRTSKKTVTLREASHTERACPKI
jgi:hypothetical protein